MTEKIFKKFEDLEPAKAKFNIKMTLGAWNKMEAYGNLPIEIFKRALESKCFLLVKPDDPNLIRDVYYPVQTVTGSDVEVVGEEVFHSFLDIEKMGYLFRGWEHIHPYFSTNPSSTDEDNDELLLAQVPLELMLTERKPTNVYDAENNLIKGSVDVYTNYLVSIIRNATVPEPGIIGTVANGFNRLFGEQYVPVYVSVAYKTWSDFFVPDEFSYEVAKLDIVEVEDDISFDKKELRYEVKEKTTRDRTIFGFNPLLKSEEEKTANKSSISK